jgi:hypothetical protein
MSIIILKIPSVTDLLLTLGRAIAQAGFFFFVRLLALRPLLTYCASLVWVIVKMIMEKQMECRLAGETEVLASATFVHHKIPHDQTRVWTRVAAVGFKSGAGVGFLRELRFPLQIYIPSAYP